MAELSSMEDGDQVERGQSGDPNARQRRLCLGRLRRLAERLDHQAALIRNGGANMNAEAQAGRLSEEAFAIRWALRQIAPETEAVGQVFAALRGAP